jgi:gamma-glutamyl phosphate reductase
VQIDDAMHSPTSRSSSQKAQKIHSMKDMVEEASAASAALAQQPAEERGKILQAVAAAMEARRDEIIMANHMDIASFRAQSAPRPLMHFRKF